MPTLAALTGQAITTVAPTTTATALSSIATGLTPAEHGLLGYRMMLSGEVLNVLRWTSTGGDRRRAHPPRDVQPFAAFLGHDVPVISPAELRERRRSPRATCAARAPSATGPSSAIAVEVGRQLRAGERFVYAYYGGVDKTAHERGFGEFYEAELRSADRLVGDLLDVLPPGAVLLVTADHGQVQVGDNVIVPDADAARPGRPAVRRGALPLVARPARLPPTTSPRRRPSATRTSPGSSRREQVIDEHWFGPVDRRPDRRPPRRRRARAVRPGHVLRPRRLRAVRADLPPRLADAGRGPRAAARRTPLTDRATPRCKDACHDRRCRRRRERPDRPAPPSTASSCSHPIRRRPRTRSSTATP